MRSFSAAVLAVLPLAARAADVSVEWGFGFSDNELTVSPKDVVTFVYAAGHDVHVVASAAEFDACNTASAVKVGGAVESPLTLDMPALVKAYGSPLYLLSSVAGACQSGGMKIAIRQDRVLDEDAEPSMAPTAYLPTYAPSPVPTGYRPSYEPTYAPTRQPTAYQPTPFPSYNPTPMPSPSPTTAEPSPEPTPMPTTAEPSPKPTTADPSPEPTHMPSGTPTPMPTSMPTIYTPTMFPTLYKPSPSPTIEPTAYMPTPEPTFYMPTAGSPGEGGGGGGPGGR